ncbi:hypothetical protein KI688_008795 [Linnemannia hyalina]|uniref:Uncharacterized protein n=1 Tax=Linnemannia hyalina TaxID=64524 RepID=A0A9P7Y4B7_9FUNG|nr:hypothetical protein KI688_008795 [Linnemannia hyalina]
MFIGHTEEDVVDESESEEDAKVDEDGDSDFELSGYSASDDDATLVLRSGSAYPRDISRLSPSSNPSTADYTDLKNGSLRSLPDQFRQAADYVENGQNSPKLNRLLSILRSS